MRRSAGFGVDVVANRSRDGVPRHREDRLMPTVPDVLAVASLDSNKRALLPININGRDAVGGVHALSRRGRICEGKVRRR